MPRSELVRVRAEDLEPGRRVRLPGTSCVAEVVSVIVPTDGERRCIVDTDAGVWVGQPSRLIDAEDE